MYQCHISYVKTNVVYASFQLKWLEKRKGFKGTRVGKIGHAVSGTRAHAFVGKEKCPKLRNTLIHRDL